jgi:hypothetical protein
MHHVSSSLSKIPYSGFSPVRLQTGCQPRPSSHGDGLSAKPASPVPRPTYTGPQPAARRGVTPRQGAGPPVIEPKLKRRSPPPPPALQSRGPWLARGFCCPAGSSLTMASCETLAPLPATYALYAGSSPDGLVWAGSERVPNLLRLSLPAVPPSVPRWTDRVPVAVPSSIALAFAFFAEARHPHVPRRRFSRGLRNEAAKFASCYGPAGLLALHRQGRLHPSFRSPGRPETSVGYHYAGKQPIPAAGLAPARHAALWAACKDRKESPALIKSQELMDRNLPSRISELFCARALNMGSSSSSFACLAVELHYSGSEREQRSAGLRTGPYSGVRRPYCQIGGVE